MRTRQILAGQDNMVDAIAAASRDQEHSLALEMMLEHIHLFASTGWSSEALQHLSKSVLSFTAKNWKNLKEDRSVFFKQQYLSPGQGVRVVDFLLARSGHCWEAIAQKDSIQLLWQTACAMTHADVRATFARYITEDIEEDECNDFVFARASDLLETLKEVDIE